MACAFSVSGLVLFISCSSEVVAQVPPTISQFVGVSASILDEFGKPLAGSDRVDSKAAVPLTRGGLVQILCSSDGVIYPPGEDGSPDPRNTVLAVTHIGAGVSPMLSRSGKFSAALAPRPAGGTRIFVRVFNSASTHEASFYGDSQVFTVSSVSNALFMASISSTDKPLFSADTDGDGLSDSVELSMGSDPQMADSDGDGLTDADEQVAGSDALDQDSYPRITSMTDLGNGTFRLTWWPPTAARTYRVDSTTNLCQDAYSCSPSPSYLSSGSGDFMIISNGNAPDMASFVLRISKEGSAAP